MNKELDYTSFECNHSEQDERGNTIYFIDGYPNDENEEGTVIATIILSKHNDLIFDWHHNGYRMNKDVLEIIDNVVKNDIECQKKENLKFTEENKAIFVKEFEKLIKKETSEYSDIDRLDYIKSENHEEYVYVTYNSGAQRRINVSCDSCKAIIEDFVGRINSAEWLMSDKKINFKDSNESIDYGIQ